MMSDPHHAPGAPLFHIDRAYAMPNLEPTMLQIQHSSVLEDIFMYKLTRLDKEALVNDAFPLSTPLSAAIKSRSYFDRCKERLVKIRIWEDELIPMHMRHQERMENIKDEEVPYELFAELFNRILDVADEGEFKGKTPKGGSEPRFTVYRPCTDYLPGPFAPIETIGLFSPIATGSPNPDVTSNPKFESESKGKGKAVTDFHSDQKLPKWSDQLLTFSLGPSWLPLENQIRPVSTMLGRHKSNIFGPAITLAIYSHPRSEPRLQIVWRTTQLFVSPVLFLDSDFDLVARVILSVREKWREVKLEELQEKEQKEVKASDTGQLSPLGSSKCNSGCIIGRKDPQCEHEILGKSTSLGEDKEEQKAGFKYNVSLIERVGQPFRIIERGGGKFVAVREKDKISSAEWEWKQVGEVP